MTATISDLPPELLDLIIKHVPDDICPAHTLKTCSLVSWAFKASSQRALFSAVLIDGNLDAIMAAFNISPHLCAYMVSLVITRDELGHPQLPTLLARLRNVHSLTLYGDGWNHRGWKEVITPQVLAALEETIFPSITHLHLQNLLQVPLSLLPLPSLRTMTLTFVTSDNGHTSTSAIPQHDLRSLTVINSDPVNTTSLMPFLLRSKHGITSLRYQGYNEFHIPFLHPEPLTPWCLRSLEVLHAGPFFGTLFPQLPFFTCPICLQFIITGLVTGVLLSYRLCNRFIHSASKLS